MTGAREENRPDANALRLMGSVIGAIEHEYEYRVAEYEYEKERYTNNSSATRP